MQPLLLAAGLVLLSFVVNVPCGYLRENYQKFSIMWFVMIHITIPFIVLLRVKAGLGWHYIPLTLTGSVIGQVVGGAINRRKRDDVPPF